MGVAIQGMHITGVTHAGPRKGKGETPYATFDSEVEDGKYPATFVPIVRKSVSGTDKVRKCC